MTGRSSSQLQPLRGGRWHEVKCSDKGQGNQRNSWLDEVDANGLSVFF